MAGALRLLLLAALTLLVSAQTFNNYNNLPDSYKTHIDKALKKANSIFGAGYHVAFHSLRTPPRIMEDNFKVNVLLMVTTCKKASNNGQHRGECKQQKEKTPWIDCLVCTTSNGEEQVDCGTLRDVNNKKRDGVRSNCKNPHFHGSGTLLSQKSEDLNKQYGCLGCV